MIVCVGENLMIAKNEAQYSESLQPVLVDSAHETYQATDLIVCGEGEPEFAADAVERLAFSNERPDPRFTPSERAIIAEFLAEG